MYGGGGIVCRNRWPVRHDLGLWECPLCVPLLLCEEKKFVARPRAGRQQLHAHGPRRRKTGPPHSYPGRSRPTIHGPGLCAPHTRQLASLYSNTTAAAAGAPFKGPSFWPGFGRVLSKFGVLGAVPPHLCLAPPAQRPRIPLGSSSAATRTVSLSCCNLLRG